MDESDGFNFDDDLFLFGSNDKTSHPEEENIEVKEFDK